MCVMSDAFPNWAICPDPLEKLKNILAINRKIYYEKSVSPRRGLKKKKKGRNAAHWTEFITRNKTTQKRVRPLSSSVRLFVAAVSRW